MPKTTNKIKSMEDIARVYKNDLVPFKEGDTIECEVVSVTGNKIILDVAGLALGLVPEREFSYDAADLSVGDKVMATILMIENRDGFMVLSLKRADRERVWDTLAEKQKSGDPIKAKVSSANRGGLVVEFGGVEGFIPTSQLLQDEKLNADSRKQLNNLRELIGATVKAKVLSLDKDNNKLILSQKAISDAKTEKIIGSIDKGTKLVGKITGIVDFGLFVEVQVPKGEEKVEGLVHISEVSWDRVNDLEKRFKVGENIEMVVVDNKQGRLSLSVKRLTADPWVNTVSKFKVGDKVKGRVTRITPFGAFVKIENKIDGLVHISELNAKSEDISKILEVEKEYDFSIINIDLEGRKIALSPAKQKKAGDSKKDKNEKDVKQTSGSQKAAGAGKDKQKSKKTPVSKTAKDKKSSSKTAPSKTNKTVSSKGLKTESVKKKDS